VGVHNNRGFKTLLPLLPQGERGFSFGHPLAVLFAFNNETIPSYFLRGKMQFKAEGFRFLKSKQGNLRGCFSI